MAEKKSNAQEGALARLVNRIFSKLSTIKYDRARGNPRVNLESCVGDLDEKMRRRLLEEADRKNPSTRPLKSARAVKTVRNLVRNGAVKACARSFRGKR